MRRVIPPTMGYSTGDGTVGWAAGLEPEFAYERADRRRMTGSMWSGQLGEQFVSALHVLAGVRGHFAARVPSFARLRIWVSSSSVLLVTPGA